MNPLVQAFATMVGMLPSTNSRDMAVNAAQLQGWLKGLVFGLAAIAAVVAAITGGAWILNVLAPRLLGV
jgi:hypothetical protein